MYQVNSAVREWAEEAGYLGVPCVHTEAETETLAEAIAFAKAHEAANPDEICEVRDAEDRVVWPARPAT